MVSLAKVLIYLIEFINCYASIYYSNFLFFYLQRAFGFGEAENLLTAALGGFVYIIAAWQGGKLVERYGCVRMLYLGSGGVIVSLSLGMVFTTSLAQVMVFCLWMVGISFIWPAIETLVSERSGASLPKMVGIYNVIWAAGGAVAYFTAGILIEKLGMTSLCWLPLGLTVVELALLPYAARWLKKENDGQCHEELLTPTGSPADAKRFLWMAWLANPCCYVAINTVIPLVPSIAEKLDLSTGMAGIVCSLWMFARLAAFAAFWRWTGWHYRFQWLAGSFLLMIVCFFGFLIAKSIGLLLVAQVGFGLAIGLIYYSSLYYSMNVTKNQGSNAGLHEAMIGAGMFIGPAFGAATLYLIPTAIGIGAWSVGGLLCVGFSVLLFLRNYQIKS
ncbi:MAG TPA: MFS transporter [Thermodesulfobacteriota bacterium]|nr:MFS transporter [Thermodesulfobacteriota bacterium]